MSQDKASVLGLRTPGTTPAAALRTVLGDAFALLASLLPEKTSDPRHSRTRIDEFRTAILGGVEMVAVERLASECLDVCREALGRMEAERTESRQELTAIIDLVREAIAAAVGDTEGLHEGVRRSTEGLEALAKIDDLSLLKRRLAAEVVSLKRMASERLDSLHQKTKALQQRVAQLEGRYAALRALLVERGLGITAPPPFHLLDESGRDTQRLANETRAPHPGRLRLRLADRLFDLDVRFWCDRFVDVGLSGFPGLSRFEFVVESCAVNTEAWHPWGSLRDLVASAAPFADAAAA